MRAVFLAVVLVLTACDSQPPKSRAEIDQIIRVADAAMGVAEKRGTRGAAADIDEEIEEMMTALDAAREQIDAVTHRVVTAKYYGRGSIDPRDLGSCINASLGRAALIRGSPAELLALSRSSVVDCVFQAQAYLSGASGEDAASVALAIDAIAPITLVGDIKSGSQAEPALQRYRSLNEAILAKLASKCGRRTGAGTEQVRYECAAHEVAKSVQSKLEALVARLPKSS